MPSRKAAIHLLDAAGERDAADHIRHWRNARGRAGGWDANLRSAFPRVTAILWPHADVRTHSPAPPRPRTTSLPEPLSLRPGTTPAFDAYVAIDWSASSVPNTGADSVWWALAAWDGGSLRVESDNCPTRAALATWLRATLSGPLRDRRTLVGFDFPLGYPRGFARALGHVGPASDAWRFTWRRIAAEVRDADDNANNRFDAAAALNAAVSGGFGPFYGRPAGVSGAVARTLPARRVGHFEFPLRTLRGPSLASRRLADQRARTTSSPWFVYGGGNSVGGQALVGIPRVLALRDALSDARVWPFETGARCPAREEARVVLVEIYPSLFHARDRASPDVHDKLQVVAAARGYAKFDAAGALSTLFEAPPNEPSVLHEEGWVLGVR